MKLKGKLVLSFGTVVTATLAVFSIIIYYTFSEKGMNDSIQIIKLQCGEIRCKTETQLTEKIEEILQKINPELEMLLLRNTPVSTPPSILDTIAAQEPLIDKITILRLTDTTQLSASTPNHLDNVQFHNPSHPPFFLNQNNALYLAWPFSLGRIHAQLMFHINQATFIHTLQDYLPLKNSLVLFSKKGNDLFGPVIKGNDPTKVSYHITDYLNPDQDTMDIVLSKNMYAYQHPEKIFGAELIFAVPETFFHKNLIYLKNRLFTGMFIISWCSIWIMLIVAHKISSPIRHLSKVTKDIESFDYSAELDSSSEDEIGELIENFENMRKTIKNMVTKDPLTHVYNRRFLMHIFELAVLKALRLESQLSCILMDIDYFKKINDNYGHQCGDEVLVQVGKILLSHSRNYDTPARYGGEEFIIILPETGLEDAKNLAERIRKSVEQLEIEHNGHKISCTISLGISCFNNYTAKTTNQIIENADIALYKAKEQGKNRTITYCPKLN